MGNFIRLTAIWFIKPFVIFGVYAYIFRALNFYSQYLPHTLPSAQSNFSSVLSVICAERKQKQLRTRTATKSRALFLIKMHVQEPNQVPSWSGMNKINNEVGKARKCFQMAGEIG